MPHDDLRNYMNDHLAGSVVGVKVLERLIEGSESPADTRFFSDLHREIEEDRAVLTQLIERLGGQPSTIRRAGAWITEVLAQVKLRIDDPGGRRLTYLEALEGLALGILGKRALWTVLGAVRGQVPEVAGPDFDSLAVRAQDQHDRVEARRLAAGRLIFDTTPEDKAGQEQAP